MAAELWFIVIGIFVLWSPISLNPNYPPDFFLSGRYRFPTPHSEDEALELGGVYIPRYHNREEAEAALGGNGAAWRAEWGVAPKAGDGNAAWQKYYKAVAAASTEHWEPKILPDAINACPACRKTRRSSEHAETSILRVKSKDSNADLNDSLVDKRSRGIKAMSTDKQGARECAKSLLQEQRELGKMKKLQK